MSSTGATGAVVVSGRAATRARRPLGPAKIARKTGFFVLLAVFVVVSLFPFYWIVISSLKTPSEISAGTTSLLPGHVTFSNYIDDFRTSNFTIPFLNSVIVSVCTTAVTIIIATLAGYALAKTTIRGKPLIMGFALICAFFPLLAMVGPLFILYKNIGFLNTYPGLIIACLVYTVPLATWLLNSYFLQIPKELEEAAIVDGTTRIQALRKVIIPVALPAVFTVTILSFILVWNDFVFALSFMQSPNKWTAPLAVVNFTQTQFQTSYNLIYAAVVIISLPVALLVLGAQKRIVSGLTAGAIK